MSKQPQPTVLLAGFDPFDGDSINPSWEAVSRLHDETIDGYRVVSAQLPTSFARAPRVLRAAVRTHAPSLILCIGQAGGRAALSLERVAINVNDARIADNDGAQPVDTRVVRSGPAAYFTTLPIKSMLAKLHAAGIPAEISQTAGTFVCNAVFYALMHRLAKTSASTRAGFVHIPYLPEQTRSHPGASSLPLETVIAGLRIMITAALSTRKDRRIAAGATH
jgi:pyroglutamyl-peptidase